MEANLADLSEPVFTPEALAAVRASVPEIDSALGLNRCRYRFPESKNDRLMRATRMALKATPIGPRPGVYFLMDERGDPVYVGQSGNVAGRLGGHRDKMYTEARMIEIPHQEERLQWEAFFIKVLDPVYNKLAPTP